MENPKKTDFKELERYIEHTALKSGVCAKDITQLCNEAKIYNFKIVCVPPYFVEQAKKELNKSNTGVCTVIGFPMGYHDVGTKVEETKRVISEGADEFEVVVNISAIKSGHWDLVRKEIDSCLTLGRMNNRKMKLIFETALLTNEEIIKLCEICNEFKIHYAKTSTGFNGGAKITTVRLMRKHLNKHVKIKASGGIRNRETAIKMVLEGADRIGTSSSVLIINPE